MGKRATKRHRPIERYEIPQTEFPRTSFSIDDVLNELLAGPFSDIRERPTWAFMDTATLAYIRTGAGTPFIGLHYLLNHPATPYEVIRFILRHELLHLRIKPREIDGKMKYHPPEFFAAERILSPESADAHLWIELSFWSVLNTDREAECIWVDRKRARQRREGRRMTWQEIIEGENFMRSLPMTLDGD